MANFSTVVATRPSVALYHSATVISDKTESNLEAAVVAANLVGNIESLGDLAFEREVFERRYYGDDTVSKILGQANPGETEFSVDWDNSTKQNALLDQSGITEGTFIFVIEEDPSTDLLAGDQTYVARDGLINKQDIALSGDTVMLMFNAVWTSASTRVANS